MIVSSRRGVMHGLPIVTLATVSATFLLLLLLCGVAGVEAQATTTTTTAPPSTSSTTKATTTSTTTAAPVVLTTTVTTTTAPPASAVYQEDVNSGPHQADVIFQNFLQLRVDAYIRAMATTINVSSTRVTFTSQSGIYGFSLGYYTVVRVVIGPRSFGSEEEPSSSVTTQLLVSLGQTAGFQFDSSLSDEEKALLLLDTITPAITPPTSNVVDTTNIAKELQRIGVVDAHFVARDAILYTFKVFTTADLIYTFIYVVVGVIYGGFLFFVLLKFYHAFKLERADKQDDAKEKRKIQALKEKAELEAKVRAQIQAARGRGGGGGARGRGGAATRGGRGGTSPLPAGRGGGVAASPAGRGGRGGRGAAGGGAAAVVAPPPPPPKVPVASILPAAARESDPIQKKAIAKAATRVLDRFHKQQHEWEKEMVSQGLRAQPNYELESFLDTTQLPPPMPSYDPFAVDILAGRKGDHPATSPSYGSGSRGDQYGNNRGRSSNNNNFEHPNGIDPAVAYSKAGAFGSNTAAHQQASWGGTAGNQQVSSASPAGAGAVRFFDNPNGPYDEGPPLPPLEDDGPGGFSPISHNNNNATSLSSDPLFPQRRYDGSEDETTTGAVAGVPTSGGNNDWGSYGDVNDDDNDLL